MTLEQDLKELAALAKKATAGRWEDGAYACIYPENSDNSVLQCFQDEDRAFIASCKNFFEKHGEDITHTTKGDSDG